MIEFIGRPITSKILEDLFTIFANKSALINKFIGEKITITSPIAQTTRKKLKGIMTTKNGQIIFVDTPGVHKPHHRLGEILVKNEIGRASCRERV